MSRRDGGAAGIGDRVERVYVVLEGQESPRGAQAWFRRQLEARRDLSMARSTVSRYCGGSKEAPPEVLEVLEDLEDEARAKLLTTLQSIG
ncbi:MAG: hypothetical protein ACLFWG_00265 [Longimicrobiales bacterium]